MTRIDALPVRATVTASNSRDPSRYRRRPLPVLNRKIDVTGHDETIEDVRPYQRLPVSVMARISDDGQRRRLLTLERASASRARARGWACARVRETLAVQQSLTTQ